MNASHPQPSLPRRGCISKPRVAAAPWVTTLVTPSALLTPKGLHLKAQGGGGKTLGPPEVTISNDSTSADWRENAGVPHVPQSLAQVYLHIVFSTRHRHPYLRSVALREEMHDYLGGTCNQLNCPVIRVGGVDDHVHILCRLGRGLSISDLVRELKRESSKSANSNHRFSIEFHWQNGFGAFSISPSHVESIRRYIENQAEHHERESFQDEFRRLCRKYGLAWDEKFVSD